jgi:hypothetical protein
MRKWYQRLFVTTTITRKWLRVLGAFASISLLLVVLPEVMFSVAPAGASNTVIASDSFNRTVSNGWGTADLGGSWTVLDTPANWSITPGAGSINVAATAQARGVLGSVAVQDVDLLAKMVVPRCSGSGTNCDAFVIGRYTGGSTPSYYRVGAVQGQGRSTVFLRTQRSDGTSLGSDLNTGIAAANSVVLWLRVEFQGINPTAIRARAWLDGAVEPSTWLLNITDSNSVEQVVGAVGVRARNEDTTVSHTFQYESYQATALSSSTPTPTPSPSPSSSPSPSASPSPSPTTTPSPTATATSTPTPTPTQTSGTVLGTDTFQRANQSHWGTASDGQTWSGDANSQSAFSISGNAGLVSNTGSTTYSAVLGPMASNAEVYATGSLSTFSNSNFGDVLRWTNGNNWYKGYINGSSLIIQKKVAGTTTTLASVPFAAAAGTLYSIHFRVMGSTLTANAWAASGLEPGGWMVTASDSTLTTGFCGMRFLTQSGVATVTSFMADVPGGSGTPTPTPTPTSTPTPGGTVAADSFQRTVASGWGSADTGGWWTAVGSPWSWSVSPGAGSVTVGATGQELAYLSSFTIQDVDLVEKVVLPRCSGSSTNCDAFVLGRYAPAYSPTYYRVGVVQGASGSDIMLRAQRSDGTSLGSDLDTGLPAANGAVVWMHVEFQGVNPTAVRARAWLDGTPEPSTWLLNTTDSNSAEQKAGMLGVQLVNEDTSTSNIFQVESYQVTGTATPVSVPPNPSGSTTAHWLYVVDDGTVYVYDIDNNHALVKQFPIPEAGKRGVAVAPNQGLLYISECGKSNCGGKNGSLLAYDLVHDVVAWIANYSFGVDQFAVTPDGSTIYMPHGSDASDGTHSILDASNGKPIGSIQTGTNGHNTVVSLDGTQAYLGGYTGSNYNYAHVVNPATNQVILNAGPTVNGVRPFTVNGKNTLMFTTSTNTCGFQILSLTTGNVLYTVPFSGSCTWTASNAPSHGISLSPDEKRVYVMDAPLDQLEVYDVSGLPTSAPSFVAAVSLTSISGYESLCQTYCEREGWVLNDLSGRFVYVGDTGNVVDTSTLSVVATLPALQNTRVLVEIDWTYGTPSATSTRFGLGHVTS